jgi:predicted nucleic-acid-binding protein
LEKYTISDEKIAKTIKDLLNDIMMNVDNTPTIIASIVDYEPEVTPDKNLEKKLEVIDQFRIHFKIVPNVYDIE